VSKLVSRRPSPAFVLAGIALFVALGGTGYAASQLSRPVVATAANTSKSKPLTKSEIEKLIKQYVAAHRRSLTGPAPIPVVGTSVSTAPGSKPIATVGPWSLTLTCLGGNVSPSGELDISGPGTVLATTSAGETNGSANATYEGAGAPGSVGLAAPPGDQISELEFLHSGSTVYELKYNLRVVTSGPNVDCTVLGDAIEIS
jgi:hypothetical protein